MHSEGQRFVPAGAESWHPPVQSSSESMIGKAKTIPAAEEDTESLEDIFKIKEETERAADRLAAEEKARIKKEEDEAAARAARKQLEEETQARNAAMEKNVQARKDHLLGLPLEELQRLTQASEGRFEKLQHLIEEITLMEKDLASGEQGELTNDTLRVLQRGVEVVGIPYSDDLKVLRGAVQRELTLTALDLESLDDVLQQKFNIRTTGDVTKIVQRELDAKRKEALRNAEKHFPEQRAAEDAAINTYPRTPTLVDRVLRPKRAANETEITEKDIDNLLDNFSAQSK